MKILALEFSSDHRGVAIVDQGRVTGEATQVSGRSTPAFALIEQALARAGMERGSIDQIALGLGPGSYTGIRAALALAQGWQLATGVSLIGVPTIEVLVAQAQELGLSGHVHFLIDAQRGDYYAATWSIDPAHTSTIMPLRLITGAEAHQFADSSPAVVGPDLEAAFPHATVLVPSAGMLGRVAATRPSDGAVAGDRLEPVYLRPTSFVKAPPSRSLPT